MKKQFIHPKMRITKTELSCLLLSQSEGIIGGRNDYGLQGWEQPVGDIEGGRNDYSGGLWSQDDVSGITSGHQDYGLSSW